ncbi:DJ-1/PfpI family protein [Nocardiopsis sp. MG754419]|uniref:DJ-1/PfpI family protein n=1 Tax=Nocardiopsis sp. MG754419 TaxID=2259865 RepID=UPI001BA8FFEC|nr:DJ-1/PfpI family protein [Nocardiopsis sp. MG754419]MBR8740750.1 glutamine amidotransferase [Nocardiopsis sp. MG754419]
MNAELPTSLHLAVYDRMADWHYGHAVAHVRSGPGPHGYGGRDVVTVGLTGAPITTAGGLTILPDITLPQLKPSASAMLVLPGSAEWDWAPEVMAPLVSAAGIFLDAGVPVGAIGSATVGLAREGLLDYRDHTGVSREDLAITGYAGAHRYRARLAVTDGDLITAAPTAPVEFAREILGRLEGHSPRFLDAWYRRYALHDDASLTLADEG